MSGTERARRPFAFLAFTLFVFGLALLAASSVRAPLVTTPQLGLLLVATLLAENFALSMPGYGVSLTYPLLVALAVVGGPTAALIGALLSAVNYEELRMRLPASVHAFNIGQLLMSNGLAAWAYVGLGGRVLTDSAGVVNQIQLNDFPQIILPLVAMALVGAFGNVALIGLGYSLKQDIRLRDAYSAIGWLPPVQIALAGVGVLLAQVLAANLLALPLFIFPLFVARQFYQRYMALQSAYTDTIRSLVVGLEAKDPYTRGHSERVAMYSVMLARARGLDERTIGDIEATALLHDLGKLTVGGAVLRKNGKLNDEEWGRMQKHPEIGAAMVARIPPLRGFSDAVHSTTSGSTARDTRQA